MKNVGGTNAELRRKTPEELAELRQKSIAQQNVIETAHAVCEKLPAERLREIRSNAASGHRDFLSNCVDPLELHAFVSNWNCDQGVEPLLEVVKNPSCDLGTALWLYWANDPYYYSRYGTVDDASGKEERMMFDLFRIVEHRMALNDFATSLVPFDPQPWIETKYHNAPWVVHRIPDLMMAKLQ